MTIPIVQPAHGVTRRRFVQGAAGLTFSLALGPRIGFTAVTLTDPDPPPAGAPYAWVNIAVDGRITIQTPAAEMGQGSMTALPVILAEELDADWNDVVIEFSPADGMIYGDPDRGGLMLTVGSWSVASYYDRLRSYGAQMRRILMDNAARHWGVTVAELETAPSAVIHPGSGRRLGYGEIAKFAVLPEAPPEIKADDLKPRSGFRLIGSDLPRRDIDEKVDGTAAFSIDAQAPGMLYASMARPTVHGARLVSLDTDAAEKSAGVVDVLNLGDRIGVLGGSWPAAERAKQQLKIEWEAPEPGRRFDSDAAMEEHTAAARDLARSGFHWENEGDVEAAMARADIVIEREYRTAFLYHAQMEPLNGAVWCRDDGRVEVWAGTQAPVYTVQAVAKAIGVNPAQVVLHRSYLGGGFGRRAAVDQDFVVDAALLSRRTGKPVKVIWSREDDLRWARLKPMTAQFLRAGIDRDGNIIAWHHRIASDEPLAFTDPVRFEQRRRVPVLAMLGSEQPAYHLPNRRAEHLMQTTGMRLAALRGTGVTPNKFASESFLDEIAEAIGSDPLSLRLKLLTHHPGATAVLKAVARMSEWDRPRRDSALGLGFCDYDGTLIACVAEVTAPTTPPISNTSSPVKNSPVVTGTNSPVIAANAGIQSHESARRRTLEDTGIRVLHMWAAVDPGIAIQPDNVRTQVEGAMIFGLSNALTEEITIRDGVIQQSNFDEYRLLEQPDTPEILVEILQGGDRPTGIGEVGAMLMPAAVANGIKALTGKRQRQMPLAL